MYKFACLQLGTEMVEYNKAENRDVQYVKGLKLWEIYLRKLQFCLLF